MIPPAARAALAAHLTDTLGLPPHLAARTAATLADHLTADGWHLTLTPPARPVAPRAREARSARRLAARLLTRRPRRAPVRKAGTAR
ncbi:hypothetical protein RKE29_02735 [Streptomyces sp. B1866]|uniref:hypothetical protein n=1 Tax=Streptomyces sp. B1866 TaxID=3075431 RepID=UPI002890D42D|nr:hypothetical protein [Streptomyces sp. B1866]MDT3395575.1 hypothetical protein [Streptomyces sp. B1866]